jgi:hypothetical protein
MAEYTVFNDCKNALLSYYQTQQSNQITRLLGLSVVLFTLIQIIQSSNRISGLFPVIGKSFSSGASYSGWIEVLRISLLILSMTAIFAVMVYSLGRFAVYSQFCSCLIHVPWEIGQRKALEKINDDVRRMFEDSKQKLLWIPLIWFSSMGEKGTTKNMNRKGWRVSILMGLALALIFIWVFW